ncbi:protein kinase domain-containing protein [Nonomuraea bangladeshensis]
MHPLRPGDPAKLGAYDIAGRLTDGPRGAAFLGKESDDAPLRVIKVLPSAHEAGSDDVARLTGVQRVSSSYVARTLEAGLHEGRPFVVREHVEGRSLAEAVAADGPLDADTLERVAVGVLTALTAVHLAGITHRGLTPHNVILGPDGPRVTDVDLGEPAGEIGYRAPEQLRGLAYGPYADVFAWAATVAFAATGQAPFGQDEEAVLNGEPELGSLAEPLRRVVQAALSKDTGQRPTTYMALLQLLGDKRGGVAAQKPEPGPDVVLDGIPLQGVVIPGLTAPGAPVPGLPMDGVPPQGVPMQGLPGPGAPVPGLPMDGVPPQQTWGPPPVPPQGGLAPAGPEPVQGVPLPPPPPMWEPPREQQRQAPVQGQTVPSRPPRKFPLGLAAAVGALALLSGAGLWGANQYAATQKFEPVAAAGDQKTQGPAGAGDTNANTNQNGLPQPNNQDQTGQNQPEVTVPWANTPGTDQNDVGPMTLPSDWTSQAPTPPEYSTVPSPLPINTQPVAQPPVTTQPAPTQTAAPQPTVTVTARETPTPTPSNSNVSTMGPSETPTAGPTVTVTATPTPTVTETPTPTPTVVPSATPSATPTRRAPSATPTHRPTITRTQTPTARPTVRPTQPTVRPTQTRTPSARPTAAPTTVSPVIRNPYTPTQVCGEGFYVQRKQAFSTGETFQLYNASTGENCVVTMKTSEVGKSTPVSVTLEVQGGGSKNQSGNFEYYAGPVKLNGKGKCVRFSGSVGSASTSAGWANCG